MVVGTVKSYSKSSGYGFVEHKGKDVFIAFEELKGRVVSKDDKIMFTVEQGEKGPRATNIKVMGPIDENSQYSGEIKSYSFKKGYGFVTTSAFPDQDIFFTFKDVSKEAQEHLQKGSWCAFKMVEGEKGPQAKDVFLVGAAGRQVRKGGSKGKGKGMGNMMMVDMSAMLPMMMMMGGGGGKGVWKPHFQKKRW
mmetsp:Transcript_10385/g.19073  ORF Transcript_10385/g.19073 Transcript_10385/m.19073 type:complete len:193 (-) Transcript_10385:147-725(-)